MLRHSVRATEIVWLENYHKLFYSSYPDRAVLQSPTT